MTGRAPGRGNGSRILKSECDGGHRPKLHMRLWFGLVFGFRNVELHEAGARPLAFDYEQTRAIRPESVEWG